MDLESPLEELKPAQRKGGADGDWPEGLYRACAQCCVPETSARGPLLIASVALIASNTFIIMSLIIFTIGNCSVFF